MDKILKSIKDSQCIIEVHQDGSNNFVVGIVIEFDEQWILLNAIAPAGIDDGFLLIERESVCAILMGTNYVRCLKNHHENIPPRIPRIKQGRNDNSPHLLHRCLHYIYQEKVLFSFLLFQEYENLGRIVEIDESFLTIQVINRDGYENGTAIIKINDIKSISFDGIDERYVDFKLK